MKCKCGCRVELTYWNKYTNNTIGYMAILQVLDPLYERGILEVKSGWGNLPDIEGIIHGALVKS